MTGAQIVVTVSGVVVIAVLARFFFQARAAADPVEVAGLQEARVVVRGGYSPDVIRAHTGSPLRIVFDRQEDGDCSSRVVFSDLALSRFLPPFTEMNVELTPSHAGSYGFACGMNMIHGTLLIEGDPTTGASTAGIAAAQEDVDIGEDGEDVEAAARRAEVADLSRRLALGAVLTAPMLFAAMGRDLFGFDWIPMWLMKAAAGADRVRLQHPRHPPAAGVLYPFIGWRLNPMIAAAAMAASSLSVVTNANRLRRFHSPTTEPPMGAPVATVTVETAPAQATDPVCGMTVTAAPRTLSSTGEGRTWWFSSAGCRDSFAPNPAAFTADHAPATSKSG